MVGEVDRVAEALKGLALVELASDPFAQLRALEVAEHERRLDKAAILLQGGGEGILAGVRLELGQDQRRGALYLRGPTP